MTIHEDWLFDSDDGVRRVARDVYAAVRDLPLVCPHGHVDAALLARNERFPEPASLFVLPDHYILRMLYSRGIPLDALGRDRGSVGRPPAHPRGIWQIFCENFHLFQGTPTAAWLRWELSEIFGVHTRLNGNSAQSIYDEIEEKLALPEFSPRSLFERFRIDVLATTDDPADPLDDHRQIRDSTLPGRVIPTFRPDALFAITAAEWPRNVDRLGTATNSSIGDYAAFVAALAERRRFFREMGATATDHGVVEPRTGWLSESEVASIFDRAMNGDAEVEDERRFQAHMLMEMARLSVEDGLVMQLHAGALRNHNEPIYERFGPDVGGDIPVAVEFTRNLRPLLNEFGNDPRLTLILFTLDESTYSRELAPLAGHYPAVLLGAPWWFHDSVEGIRRFLDRTVETAGIHNMAGFVDDTRAFCSIPARHAVARRVQANWLAGLVARHVIDRQDALGMARALAHELPRAAYRLG